MIRKLVIAGLLSVMVACGSSLPVQEPEEEAQSTSMGVAPAENASCGYTCTSNGAVELSWRLCSRVCPGGPDNCVPTPPPCP